MKNKEIMVTAVLSNGLVVRVPLKDCKKTLEKMEENIEKSDKLKNKRQQSFKKGVI